MPQPHGLSRAALGPAVEPARRRHADRHGVANLEPGAIQSACQGGVFTDRSWRKPANRHVGSKRHRQAGAGRNPVVGPGIVRARIAARVDLGDQSEVGVFQPSAAEKFAPQTDQIARVGVDVTGNAIHPLVEFSGGRSKPGRRDAAVSIRREDHPFGHALIRQLTGGDIHRTLARPAGAETPGRQLLFDDRHPLRHVGGESTHDFRGSIGTIVCENQDVEGVSCYRHADFVALHRQRREAAFDGFSLVERRNCDDGGTDARVLSERNCWGLHAGGHF